MSIDRSGQIHDGALLECGPAGLDTWWSFTEMLKCKHSGHVGHRGSMPDSFGRYANAVTILLFPVAWVAVIPFCRCGLVAPELPHEETDLRKDLFPNPLGLDNA